MCNDPWWQTFFHGITLEFWRSVIPPEQTQAEADFIQQHLQLMPGATVLDVPCGHGRLALALAARGFKLTGVDLCAEELDDARQEAKEQHLSVAWLHGDMRALPWQNTFDGAFCFGNSFGYMNDKDNAAFLAAVFRALKPGGRFLLDYPLLAEAFLPRFQERLWFQVGEVSLLIHHQYDPTTGSTNTLYTFVKDSRSETHHAAHRVYGFHELAALLQASGFADVRGFGSQHREPLTLGSPHPYLLCRKGA